MIVLGVDKNHPSLTAKVYSPATGVVISQNVTNAAAAGVTFAGSATAFTIADLSQVWIICDVYENDLPMVHLGQTADIRLNAYPDHVITGTIGEIDAVLDPTIRTAKVRIQVPNPDRLMRIGMFATATFHGKSLHLTPTEFDLLLYMARNAGKALTHRALLTAVWGGQSAHQPEYLRVFVGQVRKKLEAETGKQYIQTEPWVGYRFIPEGWSGNED